MGKDIPDPSRAPGQVASGVHSCEPPFIPFQAGARFPSPAALPDGGQEPAGRADVRDVAALPARPSGWRGGSETPEAASCPMHPPHCQLLRQGGHSCHGTWHSPSPETAAPRAFPAKVSIAFGCCNQREERGSAVSGLGGGVGVAGTHVVSTVCVSGNTCVRVSAHVCEQERVRLWGDSHAHTEMSLCISEQALHACETAASLLLQRFSACAA